MLRKIVLCTLFWVGLPPAAVADALPPNTLPPPVQKVMTRYGIDPNSVSIYVQPVHNPAPLVAYLADVPRSPASTLKILTTLVGLDVLGPAYTWKTEAYATGPITDGVLKGDLYLKGYGDPYLVTEDFWRLLHGLRAMGLKTIDGDLVLDMSYLEPGPEDPASFDGHPHQPYNVGPESLLLNFQAVKFRLRPDDRTGRLAIIADPLPADLQIENRVRLTRGRCSGWGQGLVMDVEHTPTGDVVRFSGRYAAACGETDMYRVVSDTTRYIYGVFKNLWTQQGGGFDGEVRLDTVPAGARPLYTVDSPPLSNIIRSINKYSNNVMARELFLTLGAEQLSPPGTEAKGRAVIEAWLKRNNLDFPELVLDNGSGLSRVARISARHLGELLAVAYNGPYMPEFVSSLPIAATDGTLRDRFKREPGLAGRMHLKTGTLDGVRALAGYVMDANGRWSIVVCLENGIVASTLGGERLQDALLEWVYHRP